MKGSLTIHGSLRRAGLVFDVFLGRDSRGRRFIYVPLPDGQGIMGDVEVWWDYSLN